jgi:hypothetical protein
MYVYNINIYTDTYLHPNIKYIYISYIYIYVCILIYT